MRFFAANLRGSVPFQPRQFCRKEAQEIRHAGEDLLSGYSRCDTSRVAHNSDAGPRFFLLPLSALSVKSAVKDFWEMVLEIKRSVGLQAFVTRQRWDIGYIRENIT